MPELNSYLLALIHDPVEENQSLREGRLEALRVLLEHTSCEYRDLILDTIQKLENNNQKK